MHAEARYMGGTALRLDGLMCRRKHFTCGGCTRYVLSALDSEVHPTRVDALKHLFGCSGLAFWDAELLERFRPPRTRDGEGLYVELQDFTQLCGDFIRADHRTELDDAMP